MALAVVIPAYNEVERIDFALSSLAMQNDNDNEVKKHVVVVDNGSQDGTSEKVNRYIENCGAFTVHLVNEQEKGTGAACDTGFRYAIDELDASIIARIDSDTVVMPNWLNAISYRFQKRPSTALLTGPVSAGFDGGVTFTEAVVLPRIKTVGKLIKVMQYRNFGMIRFAPGHNMATTAKVYESLGGIPRTSILEASEDVQYTLAVAQNFGLKSMGYSSEMHVFTSQRRLRSLGKCGSIGYYFSENPQRRNKITQNNPDIR